MMTITVSVNCQISYRLLKFKGLKSTFLLTFIEGWPLDFIFIVCICLVMSNSTSLSRRLHFYMERGFVDISTYT